jgi:Tol biopolymer transport system component
VATNATDHSPPRWLSAGEIAFVDFENEKRLLAVSRGGGDPRTLAELPKESGFVSFNFEMVGGRGWIASNTFTEGRPVVMLIDPESAEEFVLLRDASAAKFLPDGRVLFVRSSALLVARIDLDASPPAVVGDVKSVMGSGSNPSDRIREVEVSEIGHLAFVTGEGPNENRRLMTVDRQGHAETLVEAKGAYAAPVSFSADGRRLAVTTHSDESPAELWVVELDTGGKRRMAPEENVSFGGCWVPGDRIVFTAWKSIDSGRILIREMRRNAEPVPLFDDWPESLLLQGARLSFDGTNLAFDVVDGEGADMDIYTQPLDGSAGPRPLVATAATGAFPSFSPDGRWLSYQSNESGRTEVYVRRHSASGELDGEVVKVSGTGGHTALWSFDSRELFFYERRNNRVVSVTVEDGERIRVSKPRTVIDDWEPLRPSRLFGEPEFIPMPDGERFVFVQSPDAESKIERIEIVLNWAEQLDR